VAVPLLAAEALGVWQLLADVRARHPEARWLEPAKLHLTLVFLGATDPGEIDRLGAAVADVADRWRAFEAATGEAGGYLGTRRGGVAWLTLRQGRAQLSRLSRELDAAMAAGAYARHRPRPHLTLARRVDAKLLAELQATPPPEIRFPVDRVQLMRSHTGPGGSRYDELATFLLTG